MNITWKVLGENVNTDRDELDGSNVVANPFGAEIPDNVIVSVPVLLAVNARCANDPTRIWPNERSPLRFRILVACGEGFGLDGPAGEALHAARASADARTHGRMRVTTGSPVTSRHERSRRLPVQQ